MVEVSALVQIFIIYMKYNKSRRNSTLATRIKLANKATFGQIRMPTFAFITFGLKIIKAFFK